MFSRLERNLIKLSKVVALVGGASLLGLVLMTVYSIVGRSIAKSDFLRNLSLFAWWRPVRGDFELTELVTALAIFAFLPYCHLMRGHVVVDFFTNRAPDKVKAGFESFANFLFFVLSCVLTWRMVVASFELATAPFKQSSMILRIPAWWGLSAATLLMAYMSLVCLFCLIRSVLETQRPPSTQQTNIGSMNI